MTPAPLGSDRDDDAPPADAGIRAPRWLRPAILASPLVFLIHDLEEYVAQRPWLEASGALVPEMIRARIPSLETYAWAFAVLFVIQLAAALAAARPSPGRGITLLFALLVMGRLANAITHGVQALLLGGYVPGLGTGLAVVAPFAVLLTRGMLRRGWIRRRWLLPLLVAGFLVQLLAIAGSLALASLLA